jgi:hypothetical protein
MVIQGTLMAVPDNGKDCEMNFAFTIFNYCLKCDESCVVEIFWKVNNMTWHTTPTQTKVACTSFRSLQRHRTGNLD